MNETGEFSTLLREGPPSTMTDAAFLLSVVEGPDRGAELLVDATLPWRVHAGTSAWCELRLADGELSARHLALEATGQRLRVTDLATPAGTTADGVLFGEVLLRGGELLRLGRTAIAVERRAPNEPLEVSRSERFGRIIGGSPPLQRLYPTCKRLALSDVPVVIEGETGTGKEVLAESLHEQGPRADGPFVVFDAAAVPSTHVEAELAWCLAAARGGTLLVDAIADVELPVQLHVVRSLERSTDARVLFATRRPLDALLEHVAGARIELPPLRRRTGDVRRLALHFAREIGGPAATLPPDLVAEWEADPWPGNVRALRDAVARWLAVGDLSVDVPSLPLDAATDRFFDEVLALHLPLAHAREKMLAELERRYAERALVEHGGSVAAAAEASGIARRHFRLAR